MCSVSFWILGLDGAIWGPGNSDCVPPMQFGHRGAKKKGIQNIEETISTGPMTEVERTVIDELAKKSQWWLYFMGSASVENKTLNKKHLIGLVITEVFQFRFELLIQLQYVDLNH